jgi:hypothetical protein
MDAPDAVRHGMGRGIERTARFRDDTDRADCFARHERGDLETLAARLAACPGVPVAASLGPPLFTQPFRLTAASCVPDTPPRARRPEGRGTRGPEKQIPVMGDVGSGCS